MYECNLWKFYVSMHFNFHFSELYCIVWPYGDTSVSNTVWIKNETNRRRHNTHKLPLL